MPFEPIIYKGQPVLEVDQEMVTAIMSDADIAPDVEQGLNGKPFIMAEIGNPVTLARESVINHYPYTSAVARTGSIHRSIVDKINYYSNQIDKAERSKEEKVALYKAMDDFPEVSDAIDETCDEAINFNDDGNCMTFVIDNEALTAKKTAMKAIEKEFNYLFFDNMNINLHAWEWFRDFLVFGESFYGMTWDDNSLEDGLTSVKKYPSESTYAVFKHGTGELIEFLRKNPATENDFDILSASIVAYANSGIYRVVSPRQGTQYEYYGRKTKNSTSESPLWKRYDQDVKHIKVFVSYLERAKRPFYQLRQMEDALVIYRIVRAPERFVFNVDVGRRPGPQAEDYVKRQMQQYRQDMQYDPSTGSLVGKNAALSMMENFWFPKTAQGGSSVSTLSGGKNLSEITDILYFLRKLYRALKIPVARMDEGYRYQIGTVGEITRQEIKFGRFVRRMVQKFSEAFKHIFVTHLKLRGYLKKFNIAESDITVDFFPSNLFEQYKEMEIMEKRSRIFQTFASYRGTLFSTEFLLKNFLQMTDADYEENKRTLEEEKKAEANKGEGGGSGGFF